MVDSESNKGFGPLKNDRLLGASEPQLGTGSITLDELLISMPLSDDGMIDLAIQACSACSRVGTLTQEFEIGQSCPHCGKNGLTEVSSCIT